MANAFEEFIKNKTNGNKDNGSNKDSNKDKDSNKGFTSFDEFVIGKQKEAGNSASSAKPEDAYQPTKQVTFTAEDPKGKTVTTNTKKAMVDKLLYDTDEIAKMQSDQAKITAPAVGLHTYNNGTIAATAPEFRNIMYENGKANYNQALNDYNSWKSESEATRQNNNQKYLEAVDQTKAELDPLLAQGKITPDEYAYRMNQATGSYVNYADTSKHEKDLVVNDAKYSYLKYSKDFNKYAQGENIAKRLSDEAIQRDSNVYMNTNSMGMPLITPNKYDKDVVDQMDENDIATFNYLYNKEGAEAADEYFDYIKEVKLNPAYREEYEAQLKEFSDRHPWISSGISVAISPLTFVSGVGQMAQLLSNGYIDQNDPVNTIAWTTPAIRGAVSEKINTAAGGGVKGELLSGAYGAAMSIADNYMRMLISGGFDANVASNAVKNLDYILMASEVAPTAVIEAKDRGMSDFEALTVGFLSGGIEILTEEQSLENLLNGEWDTKFFKALSKQFIAEGSEEGAADLLNLLAEIIVAGDKNSLTSDKNSILEEHPEYSEDKALAIALGNFTKQLIMDTASGAVSGLFMGGVPMARGLLSSKMAINNTVNSYKQGVKNIRNKTDVAVAREVGFNLIDSIDATIENGGMMDEQTKALKKARGEIASVIDDTLTGDAEEVIAKVEKKNNGITDNILDAELTDLVKQGFDNVKEPAGITLPTAGENAELTTAENTNNNINVDSTNTSESSSWLTEAREVLSSQGISNGDLIGVDDLDSPLLTVSQQEIKSKLSQTDIDAAKAFRELGWSKVAFFDAEGTTNGLTLPGSGIILINASSQKTIPTTLGHELVHNLVNSGVYNDIVAHITARLQAQGKDVNALIEQNKQRWDNAMKKLQAKSRSYRDLKPMTYSEAVEELVADYFGQHLFNSKQAIVDFGKSSRNGFRTFAIMTSRAINQMLNTSYKSVQEAAVEIKNNIESAKDDINAYYSKKLGKNKMANQVNVSINETAETTQAVSEETPKATKSKTKSKVKETKVSAEDSKEAIKKQAQKIAKDLIELGDEYGLGTDDYNDAVDELLDGVDEDVKEMALNLQGAMVEGSTEVEAVKDGDIDISKVATDVIDEDGKVVAQATGENEVRLSVSTYEADGREVLSKFLETQVKKGDLTKEESEQISSTLESIYEVCKAYVDKYDSFGAWSQAAVVKDSNGKAILSVVKANGDYKMNLDFSLVCAKRRTLDIVLNEMCKNGMIAALSEDKDIGAAQLAKINDIIKNKDGKYGDYEGFDIACDLCFVDTKRYRQYSVAGQFTKIWNGFVKKVAGANKGKLNHFNFSEYDGNIEYADGADTMDGLNWAYLDEYMRTHTTSKDGKDITGKVEYKVAKYLSEHHDQLKLLRNGDFMSTVGFTNVLRDAPEILKLYNSKKGSGGPKASFDNVQYLNEISQQSGFSADKAYVVGGVRVQSFSDYMPRMVFDYMQMMAEMAGKNLPAHSYTKVPLYVKQFGLTGMKINMSLTPKVIKGGVAAGLDENGNYAWADESFPYEEALLIQADKAYGKNCGTIAVGVSDAMIRKMMSDPNIRMIIPYHKSGINPIVAHMKFIDGFSEYTNSQNTRYWAVDKNGKGSWKKLDKSMEDFNFNERLHELTKQGRAGTDVVDQVVDEYLDFCHEHHYLPKFSEFLTAKGDNAYERTDGYYKMLEDFTLIDGDGIYQPQGAVQMMFPGEDSAFGSLQSLIEEGLEADNILEQRRAPGSESIESILGVIKNEMLGDNWQAKGYTSKKKSSSKAKLSVSNAEYVNQVNSATFFSGGGTIDYALRDVVNNTLAVEWEEELATIYKMNNGEVVVGDVRDQDMSKLRGKLDYFHASPVCKRYSPINPNRNISDNNDDITTAQATADAIRDALPTTFTLENVKGYRGSKALGIILDALEECGYTVKSGVFNSHDYGGAMGRERFLLMATRNGTEINLPDKVEGKSWYEATYDMIDGLKETTMPDWLKEGMENTPEIKDIDEPVLILSRLQSKKLWYAPASEPCPSITTKVDSARILMPDGRILKCDPKFFQRLLGLPDSYNAGGIQRDAYKVIGNGIPTQLVQKFFGNFLDDQFGTGVRFSVSAEENDHYMDLAETYLAQPTELNKYRLDDFVEELARKAGYNRTVWHETKSDPFEEFDITRGDNGGTDSHTPYGVFTKSTDRNIGLGDRQMKLFAKAQNPLVVYNRDAIAQAIPDAAPFFDRIADIDKRYGQMYDEAEELEMQFLDEWIEANPDADLDALMPLDKIANNEAFDIPDDNYQNAHNELVRIGNEWSSNYDQVAVQAKEAITKYLKDHGYDSMYLVIDGGSHGRTTDALILLDESQVKSADSITYDENGDIIPATERFNENTKKLKYSVSRIIDTNGKDYGEGVYLDIDILDNLSPTEREDFVRDFVDAVSGSEFTVFNNGVPMPIIIVEKGRKYVTDQGKVKAVNHELKEKYNFLPSKQEAILLINEVAETSLYHHTSTKGHAHGWLDDNGNNKFEIWSTYVVDKTNSIRPLVLNVATTANGDKILYDIKIKKSVGHATTLVLQSPTQSNYNSTSFQSQVGSNKYSQISAAENAAYMAIANEQIKHPSERNRAKLIKMVADARDKSIAQFHSLQDDADENGWKYHRGKAPTNIRRMYAVFNVSEDGFRAAYAGNKNATPVGVWLDAQNLKSYISDIITMDDGSPAEYIPGDTGKNWKQAFSPELMATYEADGLKRSAGLLLQRGGKHGVMGIANFSQMNLKQDENGNKVSSAKDGALPHNKLVFEIECGVDDDGDLTQYVAEHGRMSGGKNQGLAEIHPNQFYSYKTNPNAKGEWGIAGTFRIARLVPYSEVVSSTKEYNEANGLDIPVQKWVGGYHPEDFGLSVENVDQMYQDGLDSKLMDPITFDDDGNIIPLTERFNPRKRDPRFSTSIDDRELSIDFGSGDLTVSKSSSADVLDSEPVDPRAMSIDEAMKTYELYRNERKVYDRARAANRLTEDEMRIVGRLLRGESVLESFVNNPRYNNIKAVYEASQQYNELGKKLEKYRKGIKANYFKEADSYLDGNMDKFKDKKYGLLYDSEIADRNIRDVVQDKSLAKAILDTYFTPVQQANAKKIKDLTAYRNRVKALNLSRDVAKGNVLSESAAVQMVGELEDKLVSLDAKTNRGTKENRAIAQEEYFKVEKQLNDLWENNPKLDKDKIERACVEFRKIYDELIDRMNRTRVANGYEPVPYRQGYFPHFLDEEPDTLLGKMAYKLGIRLNQDALPTTINGITDQFRPGIRWFGNALERKGNNTTFDAVQGFDRYIEGALDMIHHTENIQRVRAMATRIRYNASDEGIKRQMERILGDTSLSDEEQHTRIQELYATAPTKLSNFVVWLDEYANLLANKKSSYDRLFERAVGRSVAYNFMKWANSRVAANMIGGNLSSAFTNFIPLAQANSVIGPRWVIQAAYQTLRNTGDKDGFIDTSDFLVNRYGSDRLVDDTGKFAQALGVPMELIDGFASQTVVRAAYLKNKASGMSDEMAMADADRLAYLMMANRSKGEMPNIMSAKNPIVKAFTAFQLEVNNEYRFLLKDLPERKKEEGKSAIVALMMYFLNAYIFNDIYETIVGRRSALDPLDWVNQFAGDVTGYRLPNFLNELATDGLSADDFKVGRKGFTDTVSDMLNTVGEDLPFSSAIGLIDSNFSGGRIPLSSAIPNLGDISKAIEGGNASKIGYELYDELSKPLSYFALPTGGNQLQKTGKAALEYMMGEGFNYDNEGNKIIRYPVEQNVPNAIKGAMFGRSAFPTFQDWLDNGSLSKKQSEIYNELDGVVADSNVDIYNALKTIKTSGNKDDKLSSLYDSGLTANAQEMIYRDIMSESQVNALDEALAGGMAFSEFLNGNVIKGPYADQINDAVSSLGTKASADAKAQAVINLDIPYEDKMDALRSIMTDSSYAKMMAGATYGVEPGDYIGAKLLKSQYDIDGNGNYNQAETTALINAEYGKKSNKVKAVLWQMLSGATAAKNNPYDIAAGQRYLDSMK